MVAGTLEARLTARLLALVGAVLAGVAVASVVVTDRVLDAADAASARGRAAAARSSLERELDEGDSPKEAIEEVLAGARAQGIRLVVRRPTATSGVPPADGNTALPELAESACAKYTDDVGAPWLACESERGRSVVVAAIPVGDHRGATRALARGMAAVLLVALLAGWLAVRRTVRASLRELTSVVHWTARILEAEKAVEPPAAETREIAQLEAAFDTLVRRLLEGLARERANSAHMAHELRTPLTAIVAELDSIDLPDGAARAAVARVRADAVRLADVIQAILVLSDTRQPALGERPVINVADIARDLAPDGARVRAPDEALVEGDERLVALALRNLVENARKYGRGVELVSVTREGDAVRLAVVDRGPGLDEGARAKMFDRYWRGSADGEGKGLGLALVRAVAERHHGRVEARPGSGGEGLEVLLTLGACVGWHEEPSVAR